MQQIETIMREERAKTLDAIHSEVPQALQDDLLRIMATVQEAVNHYVATTGRTIDARAVPIALHTMADEHQRVYNRIEAAGLAPQQGAAN